MPFSFPIEKTPRRAGADPFLDLRCASPDPFPG
jgi:hypothetical protein